MTYQGKIPTSRISNLNSMFTNCILSAPNGIATFNSNIITVKSKLVVLIPDGRESDLTLKNIEYVVPTDINRTIDYAAVDRPFAVNTSGQIITSDLGLTYVDTLPSISNYLQYSRVYVISENKIYKNENNINWEQCWEAYIGTFTSTSEFPFNIQEIQDYNPVKFVTDSDLKKLIENSSSVPLWTPVPLDYTIENSKAKGWLLQGDKTGIEHTSANQLVTNAWNSGTEQKFINKSVQLPFTTTSSGSSITSGMKIGSGEYVHTLSNPAESLFIVQEITNNIPYAKFSSMVISAVLEDNSTIIVHTFTPSNDNITKKFEGLLSFEKRITKIKLNGTVINAGSGDLNSGVETLTALIYDVFPYKLASNGMQIVDSQYKTQVDNLFTSTGSAPFYIRDAVDSTVWSPRNTKRELKYTDYVDDGYGYSIYSDGWCEIQGKYPATIAVPPNSGKTVTALLPFEMDNIKYVPDIQWITGGSNYPILASVITTKSKESFNVSFWNGNGSASGDLRGFTYKVSGYVSSETMQSFSVSPSYTYYNIGNKIENAQILSAQAVIAKLNELESFLSGSIGGLRYGFYPADYIPLGCLPVDGSIGDINRSQFPSFWDNYLTSNPKKVLTCTYTEYDTDIATFGECGKFAVDTTNLTFKLPFVKEGGYIAQSLGLSAGNSYNESLPNIKAYPVGRYRNTPEQGNTGSGASYIEVGPNVGIAGSGSTAETVRNIGFNANLYSTVYQDNAKVQGDHICLRFFVVIADGEVNQSLMDWSAYWTALQKKADKNLANTGFITNCVLESPNGVAVYNGNTVVLKTGLKLLIPNGRNSDQTLNNIVYTLPNDISQIYPGTGTLTLFYDYIGQVIGSTDSSRYFESKNEPVNKSNGTIWFNTLENRFYIYRTTWELIKLVEVATIILTNSVVTSFSSRTPIQLLKEEDKNVISGWTKPDITRRVTKPSTGFTCEENGWLGCTSRAVGVTNSATVSADGATIFSNDAGGILHIQVPIWQGAVIATSATGTGAVIIINFIPDRGNNS